MAHAIQHAGGAGEGAGQGVGQANGLVQPGEELVGGGGDLPEGAADGERRALELAIHTNSADRNRCVNRACQWT
ncbi:MAG: hypothetical protein H7345_19465 [Rubritepida sp.]|nr:hypothetical protein [Rubritepida sp.]